MFRKRKLLYTWYSYYKFERMEYAQKNENPILESDEVFANFWLVVYSYPEGPATKA
jgi:hypothetical protein